MGYLVYAGAGTLKAVRFDLRTLEVQGDPVTVVDDLLTYRSGVAEYAVSQRGTLVYVPAGADTSAGIGRSLVWVTRQGQEEPIPAPVRAYVHPRLSPDGKSIALAIADREHDIWIWDVARQTLRALTAGPDGEAFPIWTPDGRQLIFCSTRGDIAKIFRQPADGSDVAQQLTNGATETYPTSVSPDGTRVIFQETHPRRARI